MFILFKRKKRRKLLTETEYVYRAFSIGALVGIAGLFWVYLFALALPALFYVMGPIRPGKVFYVFILGVLTPVWLYLPWYLYDNYFFISCQ